MSLDSTVTYWNRTYHNAEELGIPTVPSSFARDVVLPAIQTSCTLLELGCGNGRDALYFAEHGIEVDGVDISSEIVETLKSRVGKCDCDMQSVDCCRERCGKVNPHFFCGDFSQVSLSHVYDVVYSRFTIHAINRDLASRAFHRTFANLKVGGKFFIEVRSVNDPLYGQGTPANNEPDAFITTHYRRFVRKNELIDELVHIGFTIDSATEGNNLSIFKDDNPVLIRLIAHK